MNKISDKKLKQMARDAYNEALFIYQPTSFGESLHEICKNEKTVFIFRRSLWNKIKAWFTVRIIRVRKTYYIFTYFGTWEFRFSL